LVIETADTVEAQAVWKAGDCPDSIELGNVLHEVADAGAGFLRVAHSVGPERGYGAAAGCCGGLVPVRHGDAVRKPCEQVVMDGSALLQLSDPEIAAWDLDALAVTTILLGSFGQVVGLPVVHTNVSEGDEVADVRAAASDSGGV
jgi:hypothetical protein